MASEDAVSLPLTERAALQQQNTPVKLKRMQQVVTREGPTYYIVIITICH